MFKPTFLLLLSSVAFAGTIPSYRIATFAGGGPVAPVPASSVAVYSSSVARDSAGNMYLAIPVANQVWMVNTAGSISKIIGLGSAGFSGDGGDAAAATLNNPSSVAVDPRNGDLYIADTGNNRVRWVNHSDGSIHTVAGNGSKGYDGYATVPTSAGLNTPQGVAVDSSGNLYIADTYDHLVLMVSNGTLSIVVGGDIYSGFGHPAVGTSIWGPDAVAVDSNGDLYIATSVACFVGKVTKSSGTYTLAAGIDPGTASIPSCGYNGDNIAATGAQLSYPQGVALDANHNLYIADSSNYRIRKVDTLGTITTVAGAGQAGDSTSEGIAATSAFLSLPAGVTVDASSGDLYFCVTEKVRKVVHSDGKIYTVAGSYSPSLSAEGGQATNAQIALYGAPLAADSSGNVYFADWARSAVRKVTASTGIVTTVAGTGTFGYGGDGGLATGAQLGQPVGVALDLSGNLYIADSYYHVIRKVSASTKNISTIAGTGQGGFNGDGPAATTRLWNPVGVAVDANGVVYVADTFNSRVRKVTGGTVTTVAGTGTTGYNGDNISATTAQLYYPYGVAVDSNGILYIADSYNFRIRMVSNSTITTVAGSASQYSYSGDGGAATSAGLGMVYGVAVDFDGNLFISGSDNKRVREVSGGVINTVAGNGTTGYSGDGNGCLANCAQLNNPMGLATAGGRVFIADTTDGASRIRVLDPITTATVSVTINAAGAGAAVSVSVDGVATNLPATFSWMQGSVHTLNAGPIAISTGVQDALQSWTLTNGSSVSLAGLDATQTVTLCSPNAVTYTANYALQYYLTTSAGAGGSISPPSGWFNAASGVWVSAQANTGYVFNGFSGALTGTTTPQGLYMQGPASVSASFGVTSIITTVPAGLSVTVDGAQYTIPASFSWTPGTQHTVSAGSPIPGPAGSQYVFQSWSQGGNASQTLTAPSTATTYTATYKTQYLLTTAANTGGSISPPSGYYDVDSGVSVSASAGTGYYFTGFSGALSGTSVPQTVTMSGPMSVSATFAPLTGIASVPSGLSVTVDGVAYTTPAYFNWTPGSQHTVSAASPIPGGTGTQYVYQGWSQGGNAAQTIAAPSNQITYTVTYKTQYLLTTSAGTGGSILPPSGYFDANSIVSVSASANSGYSFGGFSGALTGTGSPQSVTMTGPLSVSASFGVVTTIASVPSGLTVTVDGSAVVTPADFTWTPGTVHPVSASTTVAGTTGTQYVYLNWSQGGNAAQSITAPSSPATYTVNYKTQYLLTTSAATGGSILPPSGYFDANSIVSVSASANTGYSFTGFTGALTGTTSPQSVTMSGPLSVSAGFSSTSGTATTTTMNAPAGLTYSTGAQSITLSASVTSTSTVNSGTVSFTLLGTTVSGNVNNGAANAGFTVPGGTAAGSYTIQAVYNPGTGFAASSDSTRQLQIAKATPMITWSNPADISVGTALGSTQLNATANVPGAFVYAPPAGTVLSLGNAQTLSTTFTPTDTTDDTTAVKSVLINVVAKATPVITWSNPAGIVYGTALGSTQLNATANVPGTFVYTPPAGTVLQAGLHQTLSTTFTPTDSADYTTAAKSVQIDVSKATPVITWAAPAPITYGGALGNGQLNASSAGVAGTFVYTPLAGTVLPVGNGQTLSVAFTPTDATDYATAAASTTINVNAAPSPPSGVDLVVTKVLTRTGGNVVVQVSVSNTGGTPANNVTLTSVKVGSLGATPLPQNLGTVGASASAQATVSVPGSVGGSGVASSLTAAGTYTGGTFSLSMRITLP